MTGSRLALVELAEMVRRAPPRAGPCRVVAVDGRAGAGKSTLAGRLAPLLPGPVLSMDDLYPGWNGLAAGVRTLAADVLRVLAAGGPATYRQWDWAADRHGGTGTVEPSPFLVVEGVGAGASAVAPYLSLLVWLEAAEPIRRTRALGRDGDAFRPHWTRWARQEEALLAQDRTPDRADVVVDADPSVPYEPATEVVLARPVRGASSTGRG